MKVRELSEILNKLNPDWEVVLTTDKAVSNDLTGVLEIVNVTTFTSLYNDMPSAAILWGE